MGYSVIYLENHKCKICEATKRNVIEPVAVFVPKGEESLKSELEKLNSEQLEERLKEHYQNVKGRIKTQVPNENFLTYRTCIFHCEKGNEIWMENFNDGYEEYVKRREKAIQEKKSFDEKFEIRWNKNLVNEFWRRIRAYRFAVDYKEKWDSFKGTAEEKWEQLKQQFSEETQNELEKHRILINFYLFDQNRKTNYNFSYFYFPGFRNKRSKNNIRNNKPKYYFYSFFFKKEKIEFIKFANFYRSTFLDDFNFGKFKFKKLNFSKAKFYGEVFYTNTKFKKETKFDHSLFYNRAIFHKAEFLDKISFRESKFVGISKFEEAKFYGSVDLEKVKFLNEVKFARSEIMDDIKFIHTKFLNRVIFNRAFFKKKVYFTSSYFAKYATFEEGLFENSISFKKTKFNGNISFNKTNIYNDIILLETTINGNIYFFLNKPVLSFEFQNITLSENARIEIKILKTCKFVLKGIDNQSNNLFFYNIEILELKDYEKERRIEIEKENLENINEDIFFEIENSPNLKIINSHLNQTKFINCDFAKAKHIKIETSDLAETKFINIDWEDISEKRICKELFDKQPKKARDIYRQLKLVLDKQEDHITANGFYALEMRAYEKELQNKKWKDAFQEKLVFTIHKWASNFGQSWIRPLMWIIFLTFIVSIYFHYDEFNIWYLYDENYFLIPHNLLNSFENAVENFFKTLNIFKIFKNNNYSFKVPFYYTVTSIYTILLTFLIYQFIVSVRRRVKR